MIEGVFQVIVSNKKQEESIKIDVQVHLRIHKSHLKRRKGTRQIMLDSSLLFDSCGLADSY